MALAAVAAPIVAGLSGASMITIGGLALGAVGALTGNDTLAKVGSLIGLAGGFLGASGIAGGAQEAAAGLQSGGAAGIAAGAAEGGAQAAGAAGAEADGIINSAMSPEAIIGGADPTSIAVTPESGVVTGGAPQSGGVINSRISGGNPLTEVGPDFGGDTVLRHPAIERAVLGEPSNGGLVSKVIDWAKDPRNAVLAHGLVTTGGRMLQAGFSEDPAAERVTVRNAIELAELENRTRNIAGIANVRPLNIVQPGVSPFGDTPYRSPAVGMVNRRIA